MAQSVDGTAKRRDRRPFESVRKQPSSVAVEGVVNGWTSQSEARAGWGQRRRMERRRAVAMKENEYA